MCPNETFFLASFFILHLIENISSICSNVPVWVLEEENGSGSSGKRTHTHTRVHPH